nr:polysaccharide pyruvyl transferase family protein [uncultured Lachnoanaerobaculum sp.]
MKKIGMLTFYSEYNYGAMLQAYALQTKIKELGYNAEFLRFFDRKFKEEKPTNAICKVKKILKNLKSVEFSIKKYIINRHIGECKYSLFDDFVERYISTSRNAYYSLEDLKKADNEYDAFVTGSDMVWSDIGQNLDAYFLTFASEGKRISYAPSLTGRENETVEQREQYKNWINRIDFLSCREKYGVDYISNITGRKAKRVVDPTLLIEKEVWKDKFHIEKRHGQPYILCYMFRGIKKAMLKKIKYYAKENNLRIIFIPMSVQETLYDLKNGSDASYGPKEFVELFYNASYVVTNSFHGLLFSLIMNKPFSLIHRGKGNEWLKHEERMTNILSLLGIENCFVNGSDFDMNLNWDIDYNIINSKISELRRDSLDYLSNALKSINCRQESKEKRRYMKISELNIDSECTGCSACYNVCPVDAISMKFNFEGFLYPYIDDSLCVNCAKCVRCCHIVNTKELKFPEETYCGAGKGEFIENSASGGMFAVFAKYVIEELSGVVYGVELDLRDNICRHVEINKVEDIYRIQNSKYVQSEISDVFPLCKKNLLEGRQVLFSGTPCQISGLRNYLGCEFDNLLTVDIICHGVPSPKLLSMYIKNELPDNITKLRFRHRLEASLRRSAYDINYEVNGHTIIKPGGNDIYYNAFINGESLRECCYTCKYAREDRISDITIGDCDSWKLYKGLEKDNIISGILINSTKGENFWRECNKRITYTKLDYKEECIINHQLRRPFIRPTRRDTIYKDLSNLKWAEFKEKQQKTQNDMTLKIKRTVYKIFTQRIDLPCV